MENLKITKDGRLLMDVWSQKNDNFRRDVDATDKVQYCFNYPCKLDGEVTLRSVCQLIKNINAYELLSPMLTNSPEWLEEIVNECLESDNIDQKDNSLIVSWRCTLDECLEDEKETELWVSADVHKFNSLENETYSLGFSPTGDIADCPIVLDNKFTIIDGRSEAWNKQKKFRESPSEEDKDLLSPHMELLSTKKDFTLQEILYCIFWELTFFGSPKDRDTAGEELLRRMEDVESGKTELVPLEEIKSWSE